MTEFKDILSIAGKGGLHKMVGKSKSSIIVESLETGKRFPVFGTNQISTLEEIAIFTQTGEKALKDVFKNIQEKEKGGTAPELGNDAVKLREYFGEVLPEFDRDKVFLSDIKKVLKWYNELMIKNLLDFSEEASDAEADAEAVEPQE